MNTTTVKLICLYVATIGTAGASSGECYARVMNEVRTLDGHNAVVALLLNGGLATQSNHWLTLTKDGQAVYSEIVLAAGEANYQASKVQG